MDQDRFLQIKQLFLKASALPDEESRTWLDEHCPDPNLRSDVERLLSDHVKAADALETPAFELAGLAAQEPKSRVGEQIGPYRIESVLGQGGMGVVYRAQQQQPERPVALKLIRGVVDPERARRLELEARALALLRHPGIVPLYEQGRTEDGTPWIAMEYVAGIPLNQFVRRHAVSQKTRLRLFLELCDAIAHAHLKGIVHRDLKPANVLICETLETNHSVNSGSSGSRIGAVRVLDFGLARFTGVDLTLSSSLTRPGQAVGTVMYMSPEQARSEEIDQRTDVYALGVILYELLTDGRPFDLEGLWVVEAIQRIVSTDPRPLTELTPGLDRDLVTIVMKGLEKQPSQRYQSVTALAGDVERFLDNLPILAHRPSTLYQIRKLVHRHRVFSMSALVLLLALLLAGSAFAWLQARQVERLTRERDLARAVVGFQSRLFAAEGVAGDPDIKVASLLDAASLNVDAAFQEMPVVEAQVRHTLGATYQALGLFQEAEPHLVQALAMRRQRLGEDAKETLETRRKVATLQLELGRMQEALTEMRDLLEDCSRSLGSGHPATLATRTELGTVLRFNSRLEESEQTYRANLELLAHDQAAEAALYLRTTSELAATVRLLGNPAESERLLREVLPRMSQLLGEDSPITNQAHSNLVLALRARGELDAALELQTELIESRRQLLGEEHPLTLTALNNLANLLFGLRRFEQAETTLLALLEVKRRVLGNDHQSTVTTLGNLAVLLGQTDRMAEALPLLKEVVALDEQNFGVEHYSTLTARLNLAHALIAAQRTEEGLALNREVAEDFRRTLGPEHPDTIGAFGNLGAQLQQLGRLDEAVEVLAEALELARQQRGLEDPETHFLQYNLAATQRKLNRAEEARVLYEQLLALPDGKLTQEAGLPWLIRAGYGHCLLALGLTDEAELQLVEAHAGLGDLYGPRHSRTLDLVRSLVKICASQGRDADAEEYRRLLDAPAPENRDD